MDAPFTARSLADHALRSPAGEWDRKQKRRQNVERAPFPPRCHECGCPLTECSVSRLGVERTCEECAQWA